MGTVTVWNDYTTEVELRKEIRSLHVVMTRVFQVGVGFLIAANAALFYIRKDVVEKLISLGKLGPGQLLPLDRFLIGTIFLAMIAMLFVFVSRRLAKRYIFYREQLIPKSINGSQIDELPSHPKMLLYVSLLYFAFPLFDILLYGYLGVLVRFKYGI